jgi:cysteine desulfurase
VVRTFVSAVEHDSVLRAKPGAVCLPVDGEGVVRLDALETFLAAAERPALVSVMLVNNETGVIQPIGRVVEIARRYGALVHTDAVQAVGKMDVNLAVLGVDLLTLSAHKLGGPQGAGALVLGRDLDLRAQLVGGGQERGRRAGTENVAALAGFGAAAVAAREDLAAEPWLGALRDRIEREILAACPGVKVAGANAPRVGTTTCLLMPGVPAETQLMAFDLAGVAVSSGAACSSGKVQPSHVLAAMGYGEAEAKTAVRASFGWATLESDAERFIEVWIGVYQRLGTQAAAE